MGMTSIIYIIKFFKRKKKCKCQFEFKKNQSTPDTVVEVDKFHSDEFENETSFCGSYAFDCVSYKILVDKLYLGLYVLI